MPALFSGKFVLRIPASLHKSLSAQATQKGWSLNALCTRILEKGLKNGIESSRGMYDRLVKNLRKRFGRDLLGVLLIGSQVSGEATSLSDRDFLIVLSPGVPLSRLFYHWWDDEIRNPGKEQWNPQFVDLPQSPTEAGSIWFECALNHQILWEKGSRVSHFIVQLNNLIAGDEIRRYWSNGHPYWAWRKNEA